MNDEQRAALVEEITQAQHDAWPGVDADFIVNTEAIMPIIDRLLAARTVPATVDDAAVERAEEDIDELIMKHATDTVWINDAMTIGDLTRDMARAALIAAGAAPELDALLDLVRQRHDDGTVTWVHYIAFETNVHGYVVSLYRDVFEDEIASGTGATRMAAIADAVAKARAQQKDGSSL